MVSFRYLKDRVVSRKLVFTATIIIISVNLALFFQNCSFSTAISDTVPENTDGLLGLPPNDTTPTQDQPIKEKPSTVAKISFSEVSLLASRVNGEGTSLKLILDKPAITSFEVNVKVYGDAIYGIDHNFPNQKISFEPGMNEKEINVPLIANSLDTESRRIYAAITSVSDPGVTIDNNYIAAIDLIDERLDIKAVELADSGSFPMTFCSILSDKTVRCWGDNMAYQLGTGSLTPKESAFPVRIQKPVSDIYKSVSLGGYSTFGFVCGLLEQGGVKCWGQKILPSATTLPTSVDNNTDYVKISTGLNACGLTSAGKIRCWGRDLSNTQSVSIVNPTEISVPGAANLKFIDMSAGYVGTSGHVCFIDSEYKLYCWGSNDRHQFGNGNTISSTVPVLIPLSIKAKRVFAGMTGTCILNLNDQLYCTEGAKGFTSLDGTDTYKSVSMGNGTLCAISTTQKLKCKGSGNYFQLGLGAEVPSTDKFVEIDGNESYQAVMSSYTSTCALTIGGRIKCFGRNDSSQLGNGVVDMDWKNVDRFIVNQGTPRYKMLSGASGDDISMSCGLEFEQGGVFCWGEKYSKSSVLHRSYPVNLNMGTGYTYISNYNDGICGIQSDQHIYCYLGVSLSAKIELKKMDSGYKFQSVVIGGLKKICGLTIDNKIRCTSDANTFSDIDPGESYKRVVASSAPHFCGLTSGNLIKCWGDNDYGQVNGVPSSEVLAPALVSSTMTFSELSVANGGSCGISIPSYSLVCWGTLDTPLYTGAKSFVPTTFAPNLQFDRVSMGGSNALIVRKKDGKIAYRDRYGYFVGSDINIPDVSAFAFSTGGYHAGFLNSEGYYIGVGFNLYALSKGNGETILRPEFVRRLYDQ